MPGSSSAAVDDAGHVETRPRRNRRETVEGPPTHGTLLAGAPELFSRSGIFVCLVELRLNPAFAVLFLRTQNLSHHGSLAGLQRVRAMTWFLAGASWRLFPLTHGQIHLHAGLSVSAPS